MRSSKLLDQIESEAMSGDVVKALRLCLSLGGRTGSTGLRDWASKELSGYSPEDLPDYRRIYAPLQVDGAVFGGYVKGETIAPFALPEFARDFVSEEVPLWQSIPALVDLAASAAKKDEPVRLSPSGSADLVFLMNSQPDQTNRIERLYWAVSPIAVTEVVDRVRSILVGLVAEMRSGMDQGEPLPSPEVATQAVNVVINGHGNRVTMRRSAVVSTSGEEPKSRTRRFVELVAWVVTIGGGVLLAVQVVVD